MKKQNLSLIAASSAILLCFAGCDLLLPEKPDVGKAAGIGRVLLTISAAADTEPAVFAEVSWEEASPRTLLPEFGILTYTVAITGKGETVPVFDETIAVPSLTVDLSPGEYSLMVRAYEAGNSGAVAGGTAEVTITANEITDAEVRLLALGLGGTGLLHYSVSLPGDMVLEKGTLRFINIFDENHVELIDLLADGMSGTITVQSGYYRITLDAFGIVSGQGKTVAKTSVAHINDDRQTSVAYSLAAEDFVNTDIYTAASGAEFAAAISSVQYAISDNITILVTASFSAAPVTLSGLSYSGKIITIRSRGNNTISLGSVGSLLSLGGGSNSGSITVILKDITLL
jgi:hypothetical protein